MRLAILEPKLHPHGLRLQTCRRLLVAPAILRVAEAEMSNRWSNYLTPGGFLRIGRGGESRDLAPWVPPAETARCGSGRLG